jgi:MoxR-like ATPase
VAVFDWLLYGKRDHPLLHSKTLQSGTETLAKQYSKQLAEKKQALRTLEDRSPHSFGSARERKRVIREERRLQTSIDRLENKLDDINRERSAITPVIRQLEDNALTMSAIRQFRAQISHAEASRAKMVFSLLGGSSTERPGSLLDFLDLAANAPRSLSKNPAVNLLKNSSILLNDEAVGRVRSGHIQTSKSVVEQHVRKFHVEADEINVSAKYLIAGILPRKDDPKLALLIDGIATYAPPPGVQTDRELITLVQKASGKANPQASDYLEYTFERLPSMSQDQLFVLLGKLHELGISKVSPRIQDLSRERFKHRSDVLPSFRVYSANYRPNKLGAAPEIFADRATFETYLNSSIDALGMAPELRQIERHLLERGIVAVVDGTNYHPELNAEIGVTGDKLEKDDAERTTEVWGDYVRPSERAIRGLSLRLMEGDISSELRNASLMGIVKPDKVSQVMQKIIKKFYGIDIDINPDLSTINQVLADLKLHDDNTVLVVDARSITDMEQYREFVSLLERYQIKIILRTREPFPGVPQVNIQPFLEDTVPDRIMQDAERLQKKLGLSAPIDRSVIEFATRQVQRCRQPQADPLNLTLQVLHGAAAHARLHPDKKVTEQDVVVALPPIFHLPDGEQMRLRIDAIDSFMKRAPLLVLGQERAIRSIGDKVKSHILGMRDPTRPLTLLIPGPTGVGKTELMMCIARICDIPFFMVEGAEFSEEHTVSRLVGSPTGYVGPDEGILYTFLKENTMGLVFIDEIEKMHPSVYQALMNFFDKATLTAGNGKTVTRPGFIIVGASNAGADRLTRTLETREIKEILSESFVDRMGRPRPELVRRFDPIVMPAIEEESFKKMLRSSVDAIGSRPGFINANLRLVEFDDAAVELLYNKSKQVCEYNERSLQKLGFRSQDQVAGNSGLYYDMRHVSRALDELAGESLRDLAITQYQNGRHAIRGSSIPVRLVGDLRTQRIELVPLGS